AIDDSRLFPQHLLEIGGKIFGRTLQWFRRVWRLKNCDCGVENNRADATALRALLAQTHLRRTSIRIRKCKRRIRAEQHRNRDKAIDPTMHASYCQSLDPVLHLTTPFPCTLENEAN